MSSALAEPVSEATALAREMEQLAIARPNASYQDGVASKPAERRMQLRFHQSTHIVRALFPGNGAGKTTTMGVECDWWMQHRHPYQKVPDWPIIVVWLTMKFQQFDLLREQLERRAFTRGWVWNEQKHRYAWPNGSKLYVFSADAQWEDVQGVNPDLIAMDEEGPVKLWRELQMRRRGDKKTRFLIAATATKGLRWMHKDVYTPWLEHHTKLGLNEDQAMVQQKHEWIFCWPKGGLEDNPGSDDVDKTWYNERVSYGSAAEKRVRTSGGFEDFNASPVFDEEDLQRLKAEVIQPPPRCGVLQPITDPRLRDHPERPVEFQFIPTNTLWNGGRITIYEPPKWGEEYGIGCDTAWGLATSDFSTVIVGRRRIDPKTGAVHVHQVAEAEGRWSNGPLSWVLWALGWHYNEALIAIERNNGGLDVCRKLYDDRGYHRQYFEQKEEKKSIKFTDTLGYTKYDDRLILRMNHFIGPLDKHGQKMPQQLHVRSLQLWTQMAHYQWRPRSKELDLESAHDDDLIMGAPPNEFDDLVTGTGGMLLACMNILAIPRKAPAFKPGTAGDVLGHAKILEPAKRQGAFTRGRRRE